MQPLKFFRSRFPEDLYPCTQASLKEYTERVLYGLEKARNSTVVIAGLVRDIAQVLPLTLDRLEYLSSFFFDCEFVIIEDDSKDQSSSILAQWDPECFKHVTCYRGGLPKFGSIKSRARIELMTNRRTCLQGKIKSLASDLDYVILLDMDIDGGFSYEGIMNSLSYNLDAVSSNSLYYENGARHFYDTYALRLFNELSVTEKQALVYNRGEQPFQVLSGFGGLCVYKMGAYLNGVYHTDDPSKWCEHQGFHKGMDCYLNPSQITLYNKTRYCV